MIIAKNIFNVTNNKHNLFFYLENRIYRRNGDPTCQVNASV